MKSRLRILGFITIHTRQLDMVMANTASYQHLPGEDSSGHTELLQVK